ncbi:unnamed protein product [Adineta steineri]|uniref:SHSP domain-containing protein n=1 Tax=Adineta steineri TaxID=433720 RepID=A0A818HUU6_9BILA|nr:unnamed protein product [Adineta steineri]CAF3510052.1 unnamed protein product [Adineta steineri]
MSRHYSDSDDEFTNHGRRSDSVIGSGWQSPLQTLAANLAPKLSSSSVTRIVVESPFGSKKCDYSIDKSQRGRLIITARRQASSSSDPYSSSNKKNVAVQKFTIPYDADVDRLQSHVERNTNRLIIEIPRDERSNTRANRSSYMSTSNTNTRLLRSPDVERMLTSPTGGPQLIRDDTKSSKSNSGSNRKLEYRIDCRGYTADELDVFVRGRDLMVQGKTNTSKSPDPTQQRVSKKFTRKITLPNTVDLPKVVSYLEHGELRIEAPLKRGVYYSDEEIIIPGPPPIPSANRTTAALISNLDNRALSPSSYSRPHYRRNERATRRRDYDRPNNRQITSPTRRVRSTEGLRYPLYVSPRELDEADEIEENRKERESRHRRSVNYERRSVDRKESEQQQQQSPHRSVYTPMPDKVITSSISRHHNYLSDDDNYLKF